MFSGKRRRIFSETVVVIVVLSTMMALSVSFLPEVREWIVPTERAYKTPTLVWTFALTVHNPILIDGNSGFTNASGVVSGSGTESDPYVIENWDINASSADGIRIWNTNAYFVVRGCHVHDGGSSYHGINLYNCTNGVISDNACSNDQWGIYLYLTNNNTLDNNNCSNNDYGIRLYSSVWNTLSNNTCMNNQIGMVLFYPSNNTLYGNNCSSNNDYGMYFQSLDNTTLDRNVCSSNSGDGMFVGYSGNSTLRNNICSGNWYGISLTSTSDSILDNNTLTSNHAIAIYLEDSCRNVVRNNTCSGNRDGIWFVDSCNNTIDYNAFWDNELGIVVGPYSNDTRISNNKCSGSLQFGIRLDSESRFTVIWNNSFFNNNGASGTYDPAHAQAYDDGIGNIWNSSGAPHGYGNYWSDWTGPDADMDGIVDVPYEIPGRTGAKDIFPQTTPQEPIPEFGMMSLVAAAMLVAIVLAIGARRGYVLRP